MGAVSPARAGFPELRRAMRRELRGLQLVPYGGHPHFAIVGHDGELVRLRDGRVLTVPSSPQDGHAAVAKLVRDLRGLGVIA